LNCFAQRNLAEERLRQEAAARAAAHQEQLELRRRAIAAAEANTAALNVNSGVVYDNTGAVYDNTRALKTSSGASTCGALSASATDRQVLLTYWIIGKCLKFEVAIYGSVVIVRMLRTRKL